MEFRVWVKRHASGPVLAAKICPVPRWRMANANGTSHHRLSTTIHGRQRRRYAKAARVPPGSVSAEPNAARPRTHRARITSKGGFRARYTLATEAAPNKSGETGLP